MDTVSTEKQRSSDIGSRKEKHLSICLNPSRFSVEGKGAGFGSMRFLHTALPELAMGDVDASAVFLDQRIPVPFFISCMTGGSDGGFRINRELALAAQELGIPVGLGSMRVLMKNPELFPHFHIKPLAADVPVLANIGAVHVRDNDHGALLDLAQRLEVQSLVVHLNPGQELFQPEGDRDFRGLKEGIARLCSRSPLPVIVKETGFGILPALARELLDAGAAYVDIAGAGGTNWISVESYRLPPEERAVAEEFADWGTPTALNLAAFGGEQDRLLASGGIRNGVEAAKAIALGAEFAGFALPVARAAAAGGAEAVVAYFRRVEKSLRAVMLLTGSRTLAELRRGTFWLEPAFSASRDALLRMAGAESVLAQ
jgi:isopentenyl-diphosphate delta-isomerase type 2